MKMQMIPPILNDTGDCCCQNCPQCNNCGCVPGGDGCICQGDKSGNSIESAITCDLVWKERQPNGKYKYYKVVSGSSQQNMPVVLPTASLTKRGVVQLSNELSAREDLALTPKGAKDFKTQLDKETADRINADNNFQSQLDKEKNDRANADNDLLNKINQETTDRANADKKLSDRINQEITNRKTADNDLSNRITSAESKADSAVSKANNSVTGVTSNGDATVTVTKADGTSKSFTINNVAHASSADSATNADHATSADNATHATKADTATKATNADHALVADRLASGGSSGSDGSTLNFKKYTLTTEPTIRFVTVHTINRENIGNGNYTFTYQYSFDIEFTFPKQIGKASSIVVDAINLVVTNTTGAFNKLTTADIVGGLAWGTSNKRTFTFYGPKITEVLSQQNPPDIANPLVQGNIVVYVNDITYNKVD
jgi:hypothetical protein